MITSECSEALDQVDGPFSVYSNQPCSCCGTECSTVVKNIRDELIYEHCGTCGLDKDYPSETVLYN